MANNALWGFSIQSLFGCFGAPLPHLLCGVTAQVVDKHTGSNTARSSSFQPVLAIPLSLQEFIEKGDVHSAYSGTATFGDFSKGVKKSVFKVIKPCCEIFQTSMLQSPPRGLKISSSRQN